MIGLTAEKTGLHGPLVLSGLTQIADDYDGFIIDLWGVIHNGVELFPGVLSCLQKLKEHNKTVIFLSNAPRASGAVIEKLTTLGISSDLYDTIVTSGDLTIEYLRRSSARTYYHIGVPEKDSSLLIGIGMNPVSSMPEAEIIIASNFQDHRPQLSDYQKDFILAIKNQVPMVCANPDIVVNFGNEICLCAGALAEEYQKQGGLVKFFGKPYREIYDYIFNSFEGKKWLVIGDSLETDIRGATINQLDSLLVLSGIHGKEICHTDPATWSVFEAHSAYPQYLIHQLVWN